MWAVARSTHYARRRAHSADHKQSEARRGRRPTLSDDALALAIREVLAAAQARGFDGDGYRKVWARLRMDGIWVSKERVRLLMREQAPHRLGRARGPRVHDGSLVPESPNRMWSTDATQAMT